LVEGGIVQITVYGMVECEGGGRIREEDVGFVLRLRDTLLTI
jgi:hypothetical protein